MSGSSAGVTVVVACYNHRDFVAQSLRSVFDQSLDNVRVIVIDDASTDGSPAVIEHHLRSEGWDARCIFHRENRGVCATFNEALDLVDTPFVAFLAADDWMHPARLKRQRDRFAELPADTALVHTDMTIIDESGTPLTLYSELLARASPAREVPPSHDPSPNPRQIFDANHIGAPSVLLRTDAIRAVGGYDEGLPFEDLDMWIRLSFDYGFAYLREPLTYYRRLSASLSHNIDYMSLTRSRLRILGKMSGRSKQIDEWSRERRYVFAKEAARRGAISVGEAHRNMWPFAIRAGRIGPFYHVARNSLRVVAPGRRVEEPDGLREVVS